MAAARKPKDFKSLLKSLKSRKRQVVLPAIGVVDVKIKRIQEDIVELEGQIGGRTHSFFLHYTAVVIAS